LPTPFCGAWAPAARVQRHPQVEALRSENDELRKEREELRSTIDELNARLTEDKTDA
jgi:cell division protein FtsB